MALGRDTAVTKDDIAGIQELKFNEWTVKADITMGKHKGKKKGDVIKEGDGKVYLLTGHGDDKVVIKTDTYEDGKDQVKSANLVMVSVDKNVAVKVLTPAEKKEINDWIASWEAMEAFFGEFMRSYHPEEKDAVESLKGALAADPWMKMAVLDLKDLNKAMEKRLAGDKSDVKKFIATLTAKGGLEKLGQVVAADLFNGNTDRFLPNAPRDFTIAKGKPQERKFHVKSLQNLNNVFIAASTAGFEVSALDFVDPQSQFKVITDPLGNKEWPAKLLVDKKKREAYASDIVSDLEQLLAPNKSKLSPFTKLGRDASSRVAAGMVAGAQTIKARLATKYKTPMPQGVKERYDIIAQVK